MSSRTRIPSTLEPYLQLPPETSLILLTGTLGCCTNWLSALFVSGILNAQPGVGVNTDNNRIIFVSWMRDLEFWKDEIRRTTSLDIPKLSQQGRFMFLDCLSAQSGSDGRFTLASFGNLIRDAISKSSTNGESKPFLILDNPDVLVAMKIATAQQLNHLVMALRTVVHSTVISCSADLPLLSASVQLPERIQSPLEIETAAFLTQQAHNARFVMSLRELTTGAARDVSGVLRVTRSDLGEMEEPPQQIHETEALYLVHRDGNVKVFGRGEGAP